MLLVGAARAQSANDTASVKSLMTTLNSYNSKFTSEKIYLHFDKPYYSAGDTIWFKAYLLNAANRKASAFSNKMYIDLVNDSSQVLQSLVIPITVGLGYGDIKLPEKMHQGAYTLRAYTNWQQNFGAASFFQQRFYIGKPDNTSWLLSEQHQAVNTPAGKQIKLAMQLKNMRGLAVVNEPVTVRILEGRRGIAKSDLQTTVDGRLNTDLTLPPNINIRKLSLLLISKQDKNKTLRLPFYPNTGTDMDLQFMPEGGSLVAGLYNKIGFKAIGEDGLGVEVSGVIVNGKNEEITTFASLHKGMGSFVMSPQPGETYKAKVKLPDDSEKSYLLPVPQTSGISLRADAISDKDNIRIYITTTPDLANQHGYTLLARGRDTVYFGTAFNFTDGYYNTLVSKSWFPGGIINFMVLGAGNKPLNSRSVFVNRHDDLHITTAPSKTVYAFNDSVAVNLNVTDSKLDPVMANFSVTVTDDAQVNNSHRLTHINSHLLLASELKGNIEDADWYFDITRPDAPKALDNLLLTQGWQGFNLSKALTTPVPQPAFWAEADNSVTGRLTNFFNKPAVNYPVTLMSKRNGLMVVDTLTNAEGRFTFKNLPFTDTIAYFIKVHNKRDKEAAVGFEVQEFKPAPPTPPDSTLLMPWNVNTDATLLQYLKNTQKRVEDSQLPPGVNGKLLNQVNIKANKKASLPGFGGEEVYFADVDVDEKEMGNHGNMSLLEYMEKYVPGFHSGPYKGYADFLWVKGIITANIIIDNMPVTPYWERMGTLADFMKRMLDNIPAAAVKNLVVYHKCLGKVWISYIVVKTRTGNGPILKPTPGTYVYRPLPLYLPRDFYRPRYDVKVKAPQPDLRSTIHWQPNVVTDASGNATFSFYAAGKPSTYSVVIEGTDMQGHFGVSTSKITIAQNAGDGKKQAP